jgi:hypothetical protein
MKSTAPDWQKDERVKGFSEYFRCTAFTRDQVIERQATELTAQAEILQLREQELNSLNTELNAQAETILRLEMANVEAHDVATEQQEMRIEQNETIQRLRDAVEGLLVMMDYGPKPQKLDAALTWRQNDELARSNALSALADQPAPPAPAEREWRAQHRQFPGIAVKISRSCEWQSSINPDYQLQYSDDGGKTWTDAEVTDGK